MKVEVKNIFVSEGHNFKGRHGLGAKDYQIKDYDSVELVAGSGIVGDRYFNHKENFKGQITFFSSEVYEEVKKEFNVPELSPSSFRRNVILEGLNLNDLIGKEFTINGVTYSGSEEAAPCYWMDEACAEGVHEFLKGWGGLRCRIHTDGVLTKGAHSLNVL